MYTIQPTNLLAYVQFFPRKIAPGVLRSFFASWEDAVWQLVAQEKLRGGVALVPEFFCVDVLNNMAGHGVEYVYYTVDDTLQPDVNDFVKKLASEKPSIVVIFHAVGIENKLMRLFSVWQKLLPKKAFVIEDCVHRILDSEKIKILHPRHIIIDSLRKVVPLMGAQVFTHESFTLTPAAQTSTDKQYSWRLIWLWLTFQYYLLWGKNLEAEQAMKAGYDVIGDNTNGAATLPIFNWLSRFLNIEKIREAKTWQVELYQQKLPTFNFGNPADLRGYPLIIPKQKADTFINEIRKKGLFLRYELLDCPWSNRNKILYLPLGPHLTPADIGQILDLI